MNALLAMLRRTAMRRGIREGNHRWMSVWVVLAGAQVVRKVLRSKPVVETMELRQGETIVITDLGPRDAIRS